MPVTIQSLCQQLHAHPRKSLALLVGIDGCGAAGKTTLANRIQALAQGVTVVHMDDFFLPSQIRKNAPTDEIGGHFDWKRVQEQVLNQVSRGEPGKYQQYNWDTDRLAKWFDVPAHGIVVVEGLYSTRRELANLYDFKIWMDTPRNIRLHRRSERDGKAARDTWEKYWMKGEDAYVEHHRPYAFADLILDGSQLL
jgi:uridine kinase